MSELDIVMLVHDQPTWADLAIRAVEHHTVNPYRLIVVDMASQEVKTKDMLKAAEERGHTILRLPDNQSFSHGVNAGVKLGTSPYICILNDDAIVTKGWDVGLLKDASVPTTGLVGARSNFAHGAQGDSTFTGEPPYLIFVCVFLRRNVWDAVGPMDETTFDGFSTEDTDYSWSVRKAGFKLAVSDAFVLHAGSQTLAATFGQDLTKNNSKYKDRLLSKWGLEWFNANVYQTDPRPKERLVSLCMIVRDGEASITTTLQSIVDSGIADNVVIVDTGSTDNTVAVAMAFAKTHRDIRWNISGGVPDKWFAPGGICKDCNGFGENEAEEDCERCNGVGIKEGDGKRLLTDFDQARNTSFSMATSKWVGFIDCDEIITKQTGFREALRGLDESVEAVSTLKLCYTADKSATPTELSNIRFVRRDTGWFWTSGLHEFLTKPVGRTQYISYPDLIVEHHPHGVWPNRSRDVAVLKYLLARDGDSFRLLMYLVSILSDEGFLRQADQYASRLVRSADTETHMYEGGIIVGNLRKRQGDNLKAIQVYHDAYVLNKKCADAPLMIADTFFSINKEKAIKWYDIGLKAFEASNDELRIISNLGLQQIMAKFRSIGVF